MDKNKKLFPQRLWELIHDQKYNFCLRWSPDGQRVYLNRNEFESHYLKTPNNQFHTQKAISFVRQMNMYGFRKVDDCYYENDNFKRSCSHLLKNMIRRHSNRSFFSSPSSTNNNNNNNENQHLTNNSHLRYHNNTNANLIQTSNNTSNRIINNNIINNNSGNILNVGEEPATLEVQQLSSTPIPQLNQQQQQQQQQSSLYHDQQASSLVELLERLVANAVQNAATSSTAAGQNNNNINGPSSSSSLVSEPNQANNGAETFPLEAAMVAALNQSTNIPTNQCSPLASSLYLRLAALNFGQTQATNLMTAQMHSTTTTNNNNNNMNFSNDRQAAKSAACMNVSQQQVLPISSATTTAINSPLSMSPLLSNTYGLSNNNSLNNSSQNSSANTTMSNSSSSSVSNGSICNNSSLQRTPPIINLNLNEQQQQQQQQQQPLSQQMLADIIDIPMGLQQSLAAKQAIQQTLIRSLLQMKQPLLTQQNFLPTLQGSDSNLLLETLINLNNTNNNNNNNNNMLMNMNNSNLLGSTLFSDQVDLGAHYDSSPRPSATLPRGNGNINFVDNNPLQGPLRFMTTSNDINGMGNFSPPSQQQQMDLLLRNNCATGNHLDDSDEAIDPIEDRDKNDKQGGDAEMGNHIGQTVNMNISNRQISLNSNTNGNNYQQQGLTQNDVNNTVLDLAKPSSKNSPEHRL